MTHNHIDIVFAKITLWPSKKDYQQGNCNNTVTRNNVLLGDADKYRLYIYRVAAEMEKYLQEVRK